MAAPQEVALACVYERSGLRAEHVLAALRVGRD
jgi:hypothetical protein